MPRFDAASISSTSSELPAVISRQESHVPSGSSCRTLHAIERIGEDARGSGLADSPDAGKNVGVGYAVGLDGIRQRLRHVLLPDNFAECLWAILSGDNFIAHLARVAPAAT